MFELGIAIVLGVALCVWGVPRMAGLVENLGLPGRTQETKISDNINMMYEDPANFVAPASDGTTVVGKPFVVTGTFPTHATVGTVVGVVTVPTGEKWRLINAHVAPSSSVGSTTVQLKNDTTAITDAVAFAEDKTKAVFTTYDDAELDFAAGEELNIVCADGATRPSGFFAFEFVHLAP